MPQPDLTEQQCELVRFEGNLFAEACPGAGKTRAIVARFLRCTAEETRKGIGLLSFTNAAIDEVTKRCGEQPHVRLAPNFVGTFDSFINRFITKPLYVRQYGRTPRFIESWQNVASASFRIGGMDRMPDLQLDWFEFDPSLRATLRTDWVPAKNQRTFAPLVLTSQRLMEARAGTVCRDLVRSGTVSCAASRAVAAGYLSDPATHELVGTLLAARFKEVIVDEAQDCGPEELLVLALMRQYGVQVVAVADLDQSIFEFRRADPAAVRSFADSLGTTLPLDGNFRSSPAICSLNVSLRHGHRPEHAVGDNAALATPVQLIGFGGEKLLAGRVEAIATRHSLIRQQVIFLAHRGADARKHAGARRRLEARTTGCSASPRPTACSGRPARRAGTGCGRSRRLRERYGPSYSLLVRMQADLTVRRLTSAGSATWRSASHWASIPPGYNRERTPPRSATISSRLPGLPA